MPAFADDGFGALNAEEAASLVAERWQTISNRLYTYVALIEARPRRADMPFDVRGVTRELLTWVDNLAEDQDADDKPSAWPTASEIAKGYGVSRATAYRVLRSEDPEEVLGIWLRAVRRVAVRKLVAEGRTPAAARRHLYRHPELVAGAAAPPLRRRRR